MNSVCLARTPRARSRNLVLALAMSACVAVSGAALANVAEAKTMNGTKKADKLKGTKKDDRINGRGGNDRINGKAGADKLKGGGGKDKINAVDGAADKKVSGGPGKDICKIDEADRKAVRSCEKVKVSGGGSAGGGGQFRRPHAWPIKAWLEGVYAGSDQRSRSRERCGSAAVGWATREARP